jgi:class 3 adenylate cyclase
VQPSSVINGPKQTTIRRILQVEEESTMATSSTNEVVLRNPVTSPKSGCNSDLEQLDSDERWLEAGGSGTALVDALPVVADAGPPTCVRGPGVENLLSLLVDLLRSELASESDACAPDRSPTATEVAAILFTDLVGWTQLSNRLWPETADELRRRHFSTLHQAIGNSGGTFVKGLGDGAMAVFSTASAALSCAVEMQRGVDADNRATRHPLGLRIGLSGGEATREGSDWFGDPVIEAARICAAGASGKILATRTVKDMAGRRSRFPYRALGCLDLPGIPDPMETFEVGWDPARSAGADPYLTAGSVPSQYLLPILSIERS